MPAETAIAYTAGKAQVIDDAPKVIKELQFGVLSNQDIVNQSQVEIANRSFYDENNNAVPQAYGTLDPRMGVASKNAQCKSCDKRLQDCNGHFGHFKLVLPVFHVGYFKKVIQILQSICKDCSCILLSEFDRRKYLSLIRRFKDDTLRQAGIVRKVADQCKKAKVCFQCGAVNGLVRKAGSTSLKISHDKFKTFNSSTSAKKVAPLEKVLFDSSFDSAKESNTELDKHLKKAVDDLNALRTLKLFRCISQADRELLGLRSANPESFIWQYVPAPPVSIRPTVGSDGNTTEDDITAKLGDIFHANDRLKDALRRGAPVASVIEHWDFLGLQLAIYINSDVPGLTKSEFGKVMSGFVQRLKGKQGRFRGNLSGKRVDFSGRTVISPDPNLHIDEVAVPILVAKNMTYPEVVNRYNIGKLRQRVRNGARKWPGANYVTNTKNGTKQNLKFGNLKDVASKLEPGDIVDRHLEDGDIVLFNRQPSLHKLSILSHFVRVKPYRTFRLNECVCTPYNADFDGDEMNLHVPQTEEARTEAVQLMGVKHNLVTPKNGAPIISAIQDFVTAAFLLSSLDQFYDRKTFVTICCGMLEDDEHLDLPPPTIVKPQMLWTGKQIFNVLMRPNKKLDIAVNIDAKCRGHKDFHPGLHRDLQNDSFLCIRNSEMMCGRMDKDTIGSGLKNSLFYVLYREFGPDAAARSMNRLSKLCARWLGNQGFSVGINDVTPPDMLLKAKRDLIGDVFNQCSRFVSDSKAGRLKRRPGLDDAGTLEADQVRVLSTVRTDIASTLTSQLSKNNTPTIMATSGSKGNTVNVAQMAALLGQQDIEGKRVGNGFQDRTLPHFVKHEHSPPSKGFVSNSFFSGLLPHEFLFHAIGGRVGLVDTAVKTAETGYMSRRLMKSLEDLSTQYDRTVRNSASDVVQFRFGDDELDPVDMEASAKPVDFERTYTHVEALTFSMNDVGLKYLEVQSILQTILGEKRKHLARLGLDGKELRCDTEDARFVDQHESARTFLQSIHDFIMAKAENLNDVRTQKKQLALPPNAAQTNGLKRKSDVLRDETVDESTSPSTRRSGRKSAVTATPKASKVTKKQKTSAVSIKGDLGVVARPSTQNRFDLTSKISKQTLLAFISKCLEKYEKARVEPGHAVGAVGAQSIGEPGTQMTLKTFHFAGVAGMSLTAGVPRIKEIINASKEISTPVITCRLERRRDLSIPEGLARVVKGRIESLYLGDITSYIQISHSQERPSCLYIKISLDTISELGLDIDVKDICLAIQRHRRFKGSKLWIQVKGNDEIKLSADSPLKSGKRGAAAKAEESTPQERLLRLHLLKRFLPTIHVLGHPLATRAVVIAEDDPMSDAIRDKRAEIQTADQSTIKMAAGLADVEGKRDDEPSAASHTEPKKAGKGRPRKSAGANKAAPEPAIKVEDDTPALAIQPLESISPSKPEQMHKLLISGYGLRSVLNTPGVDPYRTTTNSVIETFQVLGIEAARSKIITEIQEVTKELSIDPRHMYLLADVMTYKGEVLGITRFGLAKMRDSVLQLASFEKTADHVFEAGVGGKRDAVKGVSECVIVGKSVGVGTGGVSVVRKIGLQGRDLQPEKCLFEEAWNEST